MNRNNHHDSKSSDRSRKRSVERFRRNEYTSDGERSSRKASKSRHKSVKKDDASKKKSKKKKRSESPKRKKSAKHKNRKRTPSSSSSDSSDASTSSADSTKLLEKLQKQRQKQDEERRNQKEMLKATETPEEKRLRRLRKKEAKERKRKERMGWDNDYLHYTNTDNPFGDGNLLSTFVWSKKLEKEGLIGVSREELETRNRHKQEENKRELEKVKKRRQERELERQQREEEMALLQRGKEAAQLEQWARQEDQFHLEQARLRSRIRIQDGRAKPIDLLAKYISAEEEVDAVEMHEPYTYLRGLQIKDLEDLIEDIKVYKELERGKNLDYWNDITVIVEDELHKLRKMDRSEYEAAVGRREGIHASVAKDVTAVFKGKTATQLEALQLQIESKIIGKPEGVDIGYWESLLSQLKAHMARARLRDRHQENLRKKLEVLKAEQGVVKTESEADDSVAPSEHSIKQDEQPSTSVTAAAENSDESESEAEAENQSAADDMLSESFNDYESGGYSPKYMTQSQLEPGTLITLEEEDSQRLEYARSQVLNTGRKVQNVISAEEQAMHREARKNMGADEAQFSVESSLEAQIYLWSDKYRPRKPRYFNRVHTGFEWNKYNQTHYDMDNPPPKIVQGYKFNIFYPDLIDKNTTPEYFLTPCTDNKDFANLRFHAGPPYEDIAFKIVNREWEYSYKRGFAANFTTTYSSCGSTSRDTVTEDEKFTAKFVTTNSRNEKRSSPSTQRENLRNARDFLIRGLNAGSTAKLEPADFNSGSVTRGKNSETSICSENGNLGYLPHGEKMRWKNRNKESEFISEKTFLVTKDDLHVFDGYSGNEASTRPAPRSKLKSTGSNANTWPPKLKKSSSTGSSSSLERPKTANLDEPSFLDPRLIDKLDMSMLSKELLCDSMTHIQLMHAGVGVERRRQSLNVNPSGSRREYRSDRSSVATPSNSGIISLVRQKRRSFEPLTDSEACDGRDTSLIDAMKKRSQLANGKRISADDNNNRRTAAPGNIAPKIPALPISKRKSSKTSIKSDVELFTGPTRTAPEPCKTCGRSDQPERFHSHPTKPAIATVKVRDGNANHKAKVNAVPKSVQKPVALNFRSEKRKGETTKNSRQSSQEQKDSQGNVSLPLQSTTAAAQLSPKRGPRSVTCYICSREFGTASFPIHEPKCLEKWERENNALPPWQRRSGPPKRPQTQPGHQDWNKVAWEQSQAQLLPCSRCGRTFLPDRLPVHEKSCKVQKKQSSTQKDEPEERIRQDRQPAGPQGGSLPRESPMVYCHICGRSFGTRSIKIHEPQCLKRWQVENEGRPPPQRKKEKTPTNSSSSSPDTLISQKKTVTCYICGRDFGSTSIAIHEPQCLRKWNIENDKLPPSQRREQPEKPDIVFTSEGDCDFIATFHRIWENHLNSLKPCRTCGRTFRNDALLKHEPHCNGSYYKKRIRRSVGVKTRRK
ncbi:LOW QUALITY PROTEIN: uncharacterized protein LOC124187923 [Neodiprion fabricii]|uniref:LOW QUALITY PROTEIN: uncharacterized protein LOC124187923 n=1 Tax=Neodiprion fabricii TaxID=2872261 RepID=UPI001ED92E05|nr:LOW QUALITY PROTEIN: uncharacterized protein LOC124187923 [Neodiprion fabricii]